MKKSFKNRIEEIGFNYSKEITMFILIFLVIAICAFVGYLVTKNLIISLVACALDVAFTFLYFARYSSLEKSLERDHLNELMSNLSYFEIFISNKNNVYTSFKMLIPYSSQFLSEAINTMLSQIDIDKSVSPYINFASKFKTRVVESLMLSIYQMVDNGENNRQFDEFNALFSDISKDLQIKKIEDRKRSLDIMNSLPLFGAGAIIIVLAFSMFSIMGDLTNVI